MSILLKILHTIALFVIGCKSKGVLHHVPQVLDTKGSWLLWGSQLSLQKGGISTPPCCKEKLENIILAKIKNRKYGINLKKRQTHYFYDYISLWQGQGRRDILIISECLQVAIPTVEISSLGMLCHWCPQSGNNTILPLVCVNISSPTV